MGGGRVVLESNAHSGKAARTSAGTTKSVLPYILTLNKDGFLEVAVAAAIVDSDAEFADSFETVRLPSDEGALDTEGRGVVNSSRASLPETSVFDREEFPGLWL